MTKKTFIIAAILVSVVIIASIIIAVISLRPATFQSVVSYDSSINIIKEAPNYARASANSGDFVLLITLLKYEKTIMISCVVLVILFFLLFYGAKKSKGW